MKGLVNLKKNITEIIFILDRSGSMSGYESDTIGGFNGFIKIQNLKDEKTNLTVVLFDHEREILWDGIEISNVILTEKEYFVRGSTALLDAIGHTIIDVSNRLIKTSYNNLPNKVIFVITTDGLENSSVEFTYEQVERLIKQKQSVDKWDFIFLGANINVKKEAESLGIDINDAHEFRTADMESVFCELNEYVLYKRKAKEK
jgi:uncharacterized protein YegL